jgi:hypothetical protein
MMAGFERITGAGWGGRLGRLPLVVLLTVGMLLALLHCAECGPDVAIGGGATVVAGLHHNAAPEQPGSPALCHSGHCLSHVTAENGSLDACATDPIPGPPRDGEAQVLTSLAGLALFRPPRA